MFDVKFALAADSEAPHAIAACE
ncbi:hypothetical protein THAOC_10037, partial [Thalassiosira oceanica]